MDTALVNLNSDRLSVLPIKALSIYDKAVLTGELPSRISEELNNEKWSEPYIDIDEMFKDLGLFD